MAKSQLRSLTVQDASTRLADAVITIQRRGELKQSESKRIKEFVAAVIEAQPGDVYEQFLRKVSAEAGLQMALLCSVALGRTAIKGMRERVRVDLPFDIKNHRSTWENPTLENLVNKAKVMVCEEQDDAGSSTREMPAQAASTRAEVHGSHPAVASSVGPALDSEMLTGYACSLSAEDTQTILQSQYVVGPMWLTYPYNSSATPFVTISIPRELARSYVEARPQLGMERWRMYPSLIVPTVS
ncbi:hypothetical protein LTR64_008793 [Lithohypha guttulata]|uniref:uncharacterized protein n=1 Tax=Lithohypha guttulata TaxID=1690604 RepID=UPI00315CC107